MSNNPFVIHKQGFDCLDRGELLEAQKAFHNALEAFADWIPTVAFRDILINRASAIKDIGNVHAVVDDYIEQLPKWLLDYHYEKTERAISERNLELAQTHWRILQDAKGVAQLTETDYLQVCRSNLIIRFLRESDIRESDEQRQKFLKMAESLLKVDSGNNNARLKAIRGYILEMSLCIDRIDRKSRRVRQKEAKNNCDSSMIPKGSIQKMRLSLQKSVRRLRRHLRRLFYVKSIASLEIAEGYLQIARYYWSIGDKSQSMRMAKKARQLEPKNEEIIKHIRQLRRRRKR